MMRIGLVVVAVACALGARAVEVSTVPEGKVCALSFTYDDGPVTHYTHAFPLHKKYGFPGTFLIITSRVEDDADANRPHKNVSWRELKEMSDAGMEIASHTKSHKNMREIESAGLTPEMTKGKKRAELFALREPNWPTLLAEVMDAKKALEDCTGKPVRTTAFAGNACPDWSARLCAEAKTCIRVGNIRLATGRGDSAERYAKVLDEKIVKTNQVSCVMIHGLGTQTAGDGWNPPASVAVIESLFKLVAERRDKIHLGTYADNNAYESFARNVKLKKDAKTGETRLVYIGKGTPSSDAVWLRVAPGETVSVNGKAVRPNASGGLLAHVGDEIASSQVKTL